jgi:hypothetical protein
VEEVGKQPRYRRVRMPISNPPQIHNRDLENQSSAQRPFLQRLRLNFHFCGLIYG